MRGRLWLLVVSVSACSAPLRVPYDAGAPVTDAGAYRLDGDAGTTDAGRCLMDNAGCERDSECCSGLCDIAGCVPGCSVGGASCVVADDCCTSACDAGHCE